MSKWYQELYKDFPDYNQEPYVNNTSGEVDFVEVIISHDHSSLILDIGCGTGRHSLELARRGYEVVGIDLSSSMLAQGRQVADAEELAVEFKQSDARTLSFRDDFEAAIMLCEGGFSLMEEDRMDQLILENVFQALKPAGKLVMTSPNAAFMLAKDPDDSFDLVSSRETFTLDKVLPDGNAIKLDCTQRYYTCPELRELLRLVGFRSIEFFACSDSGYHQNQKPTIKHFEFGAIAHK